MADKNKEKINKFLTGRLVAQIRDIFALFFTSVAKFLLNWN